MPWFDIIVLAILLTSAAVGFFSGATREMVRALSFVLAAVIAVFGLRWTAPIGRSLIEDPPWAGAVVAGLAAFIVVYATLRVTGGAMVRGVHSTHVLGVLDRSVGLGFGLVRALVVLGALHLAFQAATPPDRVPRWMTGAAFYPLTSAAAKALKAFAPKGLDMAGKLAPSIGDAVREGSATDRGDSADAQGYDPRERRRLDDLVEKSR
ncbi:CvpA family protein [Phenylobacterium sp. 58.2.17]|uniref:CvpA family protein n=1 Tax=Phenylobacterium sp. 58.2.17 TaxID=2969306 RepID=UPI002264B6BD|nr:CvpA family protein [Phenylobacterium sp. 58.2.17]MCX7586082.1 CvpA family protein [Phenylobacterium sp. 58.2.17]